MTQRNATVEVMTLSVVATVDVMTPRVIAVFNVEALPMKHKDELRWYSYKTVVKHLSPTFRRIKIV